MGKEWEVKDTESGLNNEYDKNLWTGPLSYSCGSKQFWVSG